MGAAVPVEATAPTGTEREARVAIATALTGTERVARVGMATEAVDTMLGLTVEAKAMERLWLESLAGAKVREVGSATAAAETATIAMSATAAASSPANLF